MECGSSLKLFLFMVDDKLGHFEKVLDPKLAGWAVQSELEEECSHI